MGRILMLLVIVKLFHRLWHIQLQKKKIYRRVAKGRNPASDSVKIRRKACILGIPCLTSIDTANALVDSLLSGYSENNTELMNINNLKRYDCQ